MSTRASDMAFRMKGRGPRSCGHGAACHAFAIAAALLPVAHGLYFPAIDVVANWTAPILMPFDPVRGLPTSCTVSWMPGWNPWATNDRYELEARRPLQYPFRLGDSENMQFREYDQEIRDESWPGDEYWQPWQLVYSGLGRLYTYRVETEVGYAVQFRVRVCAEDPSVGCSPYSPVQSAHAVVSGTLDKVHIYVKGTGKNYPDYTEIRVNNHTIYKRRDETGLVLAVLSRMDLSLQLLRAYDTHRDRAQALEMSRDIRAFNQSYFVVVASTIAWEWHATRSLAQTMEFCGAYHFGQWAHTFAESPHYESSMSDMQRSSSQDEFGHPFAFIGIPGLGTGLGWESLMLNTGHYLPSPLLKVPEAEIRAIVYFDYIARYYRVQSALASKANWWLKAELPVQDTLHNPLPEEKKPMERMDVPAIQKKKYHPYIGTLQNQITQIIEANFTVPPYNYGFVLESAGGTIRVDPRPREEWVTELERVWMGRSARYWHTNGSLLNDGIHFDDRECRDFIYSFYTEASPEVCGEDLSGCCDTADTPGFIATQCRIGVAPTVCRDRNLTFSYTNTSVVPNPEAQNVYGFTVLPPA